MGMGANFTLPPFHLPHPLPHPPLEGEGILGVCPSPSRGGNHRGGTLLSPPPSRGRLGGGWDFSSWATNQISPSPPPSPTTGRGG